MNFQMVLTAIMAVFLLLGALDDIFGNRFGLGKEFENGFQSAGRLILCMSGFMVLAPVAAHSLGFVLAPIFQSIGADPSSFAGLVIANDSGGYVLATEMANDPQAGIYNGMIVGSMLGTTIMFQLPLMMTFTKKKERPAAIYGMIAGVATVPLGCLAGGLAAGFSFSMLLFNTIPVLIVSAALLIALLLLGEKIVPAFSVFGKIMLGISITGLAIAGFSQLTGLKVLDGMGNINEVFQIVGGITIFLAGAFPLLFVLRKVGHKGLERIGKRMKINKTSVTGLLITLANPLPTMEMLSDMDDRGRMLNISLIVSASCTFGDHMAYASQTLPQIVPALIFGKLVGGFSGMLLAVFLSPRLLEKIKHK